MVAADNLPRAPFDLSAYLPKATKARVEAARGAVPITYPKRFMRRCATLWLEWRRPILCLTTCGNGWWHGEIAMPMLWRWFIPCR